MNDFVTIVAILVSMAWLVFQAEQCSDCQHSTCSNGAAPRVVRGPFGYECICSEGAVNP